MKVLLITAIRFLAVTIVYFVCFAAVSGALLSAPLEQSQPADAGAALVPLLVVSLINTAVWTYIILRSRWAGWKLIVTVFFVFFGVSTLMPQIETAYFVTRLPAGLLPRLFLAGMIMAAIFAPLIVLILGKSKAQANKTYADSRLKMPMGVWMAKLSVIVVAYLIIYFTFGYFIAWRNASVQAYYAGSDPGSFIVHLTSLLRNEPLLFLLQSGRALLWTAIAVPVIKMTTGKWWEPGLAVALLFGVFMNAQLLLPNPLMPFEVRMTHLVETSTSNFLFGWLVVAVLLAFSPVRVPAMPVKATPQL